MKTTKKETNLDEIISFSVHEAIAHSSKLPTPPIEVASEKKSIVEAKVNEVVPPEPAVSDDAVVTEAVVASKQKFDLKSDFLSDETKQAHLELYGQYVENFNKSSAKLDGVDKKLLVANSEYYSIKHEETYNLNAVKLHELYFSNIGDLASTLTVDAIPFLRITNQWGSFDDWQHEFIAACLAARSGWAFLGYDMYLQRYGIYLVDMHHISVPVGVMPVLVMDMWEHAYFADYQLQKVNYIFAMMKRLNWHVVEKRMTAVEKAAAMFAAVSKENF